MHFGSVALQQDNVFSVVGPSIYEFRSTSPMNKMLPVLITNT